MCKNKVGAIISILRTYKKYPFHNILKQCRCLFFHMVCFCLSLFLILFDSLRPRVCFCPYFQESSLLCSLIKELFCSPQPLLVFQVVFKYLPLVLLLCNTDMPRKWWPQRQGQEGKSLHYQGIFLCGAEYHQQPQWKPVLLCLFSVWAMLCSIQSLMALCFPRWLTPRCSGWDVRRLVLLAGIVMISAVLCLGGVPPWD